MSFAADRIESFLCECLFSENDSCKVSKMFSNSEFHLLGKINLYKKIKICKENLKYKKKLKIYKNK